MEKTIFKTFLPLLAAALVGVIVMISCEEEKNQITPNISNYTYTPCVSSYDGDDISRKSMHDSIAYDFTNGVLCIEHHNMFSPCVLDTIYRYVSMRGDTISVTERTYPEPSMVNCSCLISTFFQIDGLKSGSYILELKTMEANQSIVIYRQRITI